MDPFGRPSIADSSELEIREVTLSDKLKVFKSSQFDPNGYLTSKCQTMTEKVNILSVMALFSAALCSNYRICAGARKSSTCALSLEI